MRNTSSIDATWKFRWHSPGPSPWKTASLWWTGSIRSRHATSPIQSDTRIATIAGFARGPGAGIKVLGGAPGADPGTEIRDAARLELTRLAQGDGLRVFVAQEFPLTEAAAAHRAIMSGHVSGKIVLIP